MVMESNFGQIVGARTPRSSVGLLTAARSDQPTAAPRSGSETIMRVALRLQ